MRGLARNSVSGLEGDPVVPKLISSISVELLVRPLGLAYCSRLHRLPILRFSSQTGHRESEIQYSSKGPLIPDAEEFNLGLGMSIRELQDKAPMYSSCNKEDLVSDLVPVSSSG
ncbi:hypothetical protein VNO77_36723 [Canavalia gladiata]|uniref:Uncharacterized protein n=1 Tax=Canavalia gladiata TaxID=3824 RepID=A0AAN9K9J4_CANGL